MTPEETHEEAHEHVCPICAGTEFIDTGYGYAICIRCDGLVPRGWGKV